MFESVSVSVYTIPINAYIIVGFHVWFHAWWIILLTNIFHGKDNRKQKQFVGVYFRYWQQRHQFYAKQQSSGKYHEGMQNILHIFYMIIMPHCILSLQFRIIILHRGLWSLIPYDKFATTSAMFTHVIERLKRYFRFFFPSRIDIFNFLFLSNVSPQSTCDNIVVCSKPRNS